ncbi:ATP-binding protein [Sneathiella limimaris]|uniref:ATP-binding protein n=1 Tax=Sneathiella limimaris TaxID=1964213 RepID=UPI00146C64AA|nr:ATP-binding protein [Sneathiella limimaris]
MSNIQGFLTKLCIFVLVITVPVAVVAFWMVSQDVLSLEYGILLTLTPVGPAVLVFNKLIREISSLTRRMGHAIAEPMEEVRSDETDRAGLLPINDFLLTMQQYQRVLSNLLEETKLRQSDTAQLFDILPNAVLVLDDRRRIVQHNLAAAEFFGRSDISGDLVSYLRHPSLIKAVDATLAGEMQGKRVEFAMVGDVSRYIAANIVVFDGEKKGGLRVVVTLHDLTAIRKTEQMRVDFIANASHELRTPLAILIGAIETLLGPAANDPAAQKRFLSIMEAQSNRMSQLINDLLSLSHIEMNEHSRPSDPLDIIEVLKSVVHLLSGKSLSLNKTIDLDVPDKPVIVIGEKEQLSQVFTNLVDNALKYSHPESTITVRLREVNNQARISVIDQGEGIPSEHLPRLTERFYRVDSDRSREMGGTGLGLAIVKHIVSRHRGQLEIDSVLGKGSVFTVKLPSQTAESAGFNKVLSL